MGDFPAAMAKLSVALTATEIKQADLPDTIVDRFVLPDGRTLLEIEPAEDISNNATASAFIDAVWSVAPRATGRPVVNREGGATVVRSFQLAFSYALATVACLVWLFLGRWGRCRTGTGPGVNGVYRYCRGCRTVWDSRSTSPISSRCRCYWA